MTKKKKLHEKRKEKRKKKKNFQNVLPFGSNHRKFFTCFGYFVPNSII